ncbi:MAG: hypothetical protein KGO50_15965, partial [Myxococcales bacterium]|nr:hypothetical protein [Myxococcales bacterium]
MRVARPTRWTLCLFLLASASCSDDSTESGTGGGTGGGTEEPGQDVVDVAETDTADDNEEVSTDTTDVSGVDGQQDLSEDMSEDATTARIPLANFLPCEVDEDCPNGTGNCIIEVALTVGARGTEGTVALASLAPDWPASGVCSLDCGANPDLCDDISLSQIPPNINTPYTCMVVAIGQAPYPVGDALPDPSTLDPEAQQAGQAFGALCVPPLQQMEAWPEDFGQPCSVDSACGDGAACWLDEPFAPSDIASPDGACAATCDADGGCPVGFVCTNAAEAPGRFANDAVAGSFCLPLHGTFGVCRDADGDDFGIGQCSGVLATPHDCDDTNPVAWFDADNMDHGFPRWCGPTLDVNCNGVPDVDDQVGRPDTGEVHCTGCDDPCTGVIEGGNGSRLCGVDATGPRCAALCDENWVDCDGVLENGCEVALLDTNSLFYPDCDDDGIPRAYEAQFDCDGGGVTFEIDGETCDGVNAVTFDGEVRFDCDDNEARRAPGLAEVCDNVDNDCTATDDSDGIDDLARLAEADISCAADALGTCAAGTLACRPDESEA